MKDHENSIKFLDDELFFPSEDKKELEFALSDLSEIISNNYCFKVSSILDPLTFDGSMDEFNELASPKFRNETQL